MKIEAKVVVIDGGVVGISALYHLARKDWGDDVVPPEKAELTSGCDLARCRPSPDVQHELQRWSDAQVLG